MILASPHSLVPHLVGLGSRSGHRCPWVPAVHSVHPGLHAYQQHNPTCSRGQSQHRPSGKTVRMATAPSLMRNDTTFSFTTKAMPWCVTIGWEDMGRQHHSPRAPSGPARRKKGHGHLTMIEPVLHCCWCIVTIIPLRCICLVCICLRGSPWAALPTW
jgi:hypothetical protein